jgi:AraC-like DNA-binding protein
MSAAYFELALREFGGSPEKDAALREGTGVTAHVRDGEITLGQQLQQVRNLNRLEPGGWGLRLGRRFEVATHGPVGYAAVSAPTLADSLSVIARFGHVRAPYFRLRVERVDDRVALRIEEHVRLSDEERIPMVETLMLSLQRLVEAVVGTLLQRASFDFAWAAPPYAAEYRSHHPGPVRFDAPWTQLTIPADWLALTCPLADPLMYETSVRKLEALARRLEGDDHVVARVEALIEASGESAPSLAQVAKRIHLSARTIIRRLRRAGTTYHQLLDAHRRAHAETLLKNPAFGVAEVSNRLGYGDPANFGRACRRWFGMAPGHYRRVHAPEMSRAAATASVPARRRPSRS